MPRARKIAHIGKPIYRVGVLLNAIVCRIHAPGLAIVSVVAINPGTMDTKTVREGGTGRKRREQDKC